MDLVAMYSSGYKFMLIIFSSILPLIIIESSLFYLLHLILVIPDNLDFYEFAFICKGLFHTPLSSTF